jgi:hypothetical protein
MQHVFLAYRVHKVQTLIRGFLRALRFPPPSKLKKVLISFIIGSSEGGFRSRDERKRAEKM